MQTNKLKKDLTLPLLIFYGVGTILGLGIYVLIGKIGGEAGMLSPFAFLIAAILAGFTGVSYGELSARIPKSAGEVNYMDAAFGKFTLSALVGWLIVISAIISTSTVVNGYVGYVQIFVEWPSWQIITLFTLILGGVAIWGIKESALLIMVVTIVEVIGIVIVIVVGSDHLTSVPEKLPELLPGFVFSDWQAIAAAAFLAFFAFIGFEDMVNVSEEARNPQRDMPRAIIISLVILTVLYILVALISVMALSQEQLDQSEAPLADIVAEYGDFYPEMVGLIGLVAIINGVLVQIIMCSRVMYGMARDTTYGKHMAPKILGKVNPKTRTPIWGTLLTVCLVLLLALNFELEWLARATNYVLLVVFIMVNLALIRVKRKDPKPNGVRVYPLLIPWLGFIFSLAVLIMEVLSNFIS
ncbi:MAG: amino acid permease [Crocinitomicaceae bacterium]|nr:amino acid permease [Crocinitomicaceae bacterium]